MPAHTHNAFWFLWSHRLLSLFPLSDAHAPFTSWYFLLLSMPSCFLCVPLGLIKATSVAWVLKFSTGTESWLPKMLRTTDRWGLSSKQCVYTKLFAYGNQPKRHMFVLLNRHHWWCLKETIQTDPSWKLIYTCPFKPPNSSLRLGIDLWVQRFPKSFNTL